MFGYNYVDDGYINTNTSWIEVGLNASHMVGPHHVLFEGNYGFNWDSDKTHGNAIYHTIFRNHLRGIRRDFGDGGGGNGPKRAAGAAYYSYWHSFVGNVLGAAGQMNGWVYESGNMDHPGHLPSRLGRLGALPRRPEGRRHHHPSRQLRLRDQLGEVGSEHLDPDAPQLALPQREAGLLQRRAAATPGRGSIPTGATKLYTLPAKARFDNGTPFVQP